MPDFEPQATEFSPTNALLLAKLCEAAYSDSADAEDITLNQLNFSKFYWIDLTGNFEDVYAIGAARGDFAVVAFRGTKDIQNWMTDFNSTPVSFPWLFDSGPDVGDIHAGFGHALRDAWANVCDVVNVMIPRPPVEQGILISPQPTLWLTGHSLGGALAVLTGAVYNMWQQATMRPVAGVYTFGQPRVGLYKFCGNYDQVLRPKTFRFVNKSDLVPRVPFRGFDYADLGRMIHFASNGAPSLESMEWANLLNRTFQSFADFFRIVGNLNVDVGDHSMDGYVAAVQSQQQALNELVF
jgi:triacylglycerol lipase